MAGRLAQPGCFTNTGSGAKSGRSLVKLEVPLPEKNFNRQRGSGRSPIPVMRGSIRKGTTNEKKKKQLVGRPSSVPQCGSKPVRYNFETEKDAIQFVRRIFQKKKASSSMSAWHVAAKIKEDYPHLLVNSGHKREGPVPGIEVGDCFGSRAELSFVGLHNKSRAGIDWKVIPRQAGIDWKVILSQDGCRVSIAVSIVVSGGYEDDVDEGEILIYTGEGGNDAYGCKGQHADQKLERGNMAMLNSCYIGNSIRVIRGRPDSNSYGGILYSYDGLYRVVDSKEEPGISNFEVFKFTLVREDGQQPLSWDCPVTSRRKIVQEF